MFFSAYKEAKSGNKELYNAHKDAIDAVDRAIANNAENLNAQLPEGIRKQVQKVMDIMIDNQLRTGGVTLGKLLSVKDVLFQAYSKKHEAIFYKVKETQRVDFSGREAGPYFIFSKKSYDF